MGMGAGEARAWAVRALAANHRIELVSEGPDPSRPGPHGQRAGCVGWLRYVPPEAPAEGAGGWWAQRALEEVAAEKTIECQAAARRLADVAAAAAGAARDGRARPVLIVRVVRARRVTLSSHRAWSALRGPEAAEVATERIPAEAGRPVPSRLASSDEAPPSNADAIEYIRAHAGQDGEWRVRRFSGWSRVASWYDVGEGRRARCSVGDLLLLRSPTEPQVDAAPSRKPRSDSDPYDVAAVVASGIWQIRFVPARP